MSPDLGNAHSWKTQNKGFPKVCRKYGGVHCRILLPFSRHKIGARCCDSVFDGILTFVNSASVNIILPLHCLAQHGAYTCHEVRAAICPKLDQKTKPQSDGRVERGTPKYDIIR